MKASRTRPALLRQTPGKMRTIFRFALPIAAAVSLSGQTLPRPALLVLNKGDLTMAVVDPSTSKVLWTAPSGPDPHEVVASPDGRLAYISNYQSGAPAGTPQLLTVVDLSTRQTSTIDLGGLASPHGLDYAGGKLYFTAEGSKAIARYDPTTRRIDWVMGTGQDRTHMVFVSRDLTRIFTTNVSSATLSVLEQRAGGGPGRGPGGPPPGGRGPARLDWFITNVPVGAGAEGFDLSPDGREVWTANAQDASVTIVDTATKTVSATVEVPFRAANRLKFTPDGSRVFISDLGGNDLIVMDAAARRETARVPLGGGAAGLQMDPVEPRAFVSVGSLNAVLVVDTKALRVVGRIDSGRGPDGLAWVAAQPTGAR
jgi:YVTN family beta-propeller protein